MFETSLVLINVYIVWFMDDNTLSDHIIFNFSLTLYGILKILYYLSLEITGEGSCYQ